jgi:type VI secretion system protein ImpA
MNLAITDSLGKHILTATMPKEPSSIEHIWQNALAAERTYGFKTALNQLLNAACSAESVREKYRYRLLMAKLCLDAQRPELAKPILEELYMLISKNKLDEWESPLWIAEIYEALYQCWSKEPQTVSADKLNELYYKLCINDVTRAMACKKL